MIPWFREDYFALQSPKNINKKFKSLSKTFSLDSNQNQNNKNNVKKYKKENQFPSLTFTLFNNSNDGLNKGPIHFIGNEIFNSPNLIKKSP